MSVRRLRKTLAVAAAVLGLATAGAASAMTATVGEPDLIAKVAITVPVTVSCDPPSPGLAISSQSVSVLVEQASGKSIARGSASLFNVFPQLLFPCDGTSTTLSVSILADPNGPPFHGGRAVVRVNASVSAGMPLPFCTNCFGPPFESQSVAGLPTQVKLG